MDAGLAAELPAAGDGGSFFAAVLATTQRQLTSSLGGMLAVTSASLLVWLLTKAVERLLALARGVLFVTVEVRDRKLAAAVRAWAALHAHSTHSRATATPPSSDPRRTPRTAAMNVRCEGGGQGGGGRRGRG